MEWEEISSEGVDASHLISDRLWVPTGWIVRTRYYSRMFDSSGGISVSVHQVFVKDPEHTWGNK